MDNPTINRQRNAFIALTASVLLWGGSFSAASRLLQDLDPMTVMWLRMTLASLAILPFIKKLAPPAGWRSEWKILLPMVLFQPCLYFLLESNALRFTSSSQAGVISAFVPLLVALGAWLFLKEKLKLRGILGLLMSITGIVFLTLMNSSSESADKIILGNIMEVGAMVAAASNMLIIKKLSDRYNPWTLTMMQCFAGFLFFSPGLLMLIQDMPQFTTKHVLLLLYLGAPVSLGAFGLYNWGMSHTSASGASLFINLIPVVAVVLGWALLGESLTLVQCIASAAVLLGVVISQSGDSVDERTVKNESRSSGSNNDPLCSARNL
ncbi:MULTISPECIES: DMT family transporter [unclassified Oceanispirochaeta]|uniref:DMT family transporter n=1 Tax=unclassified Oceanispirochaeta TaxID=2635722 RepID=UPI000E0925B1|nr:MULTISPECIES: DMT family transporter [unclassified Oceanispirochaeta]MBF9016422.1 DMT family transporter [Oceanispirochaeta sp. M2]NPD72884.1 DMT family transporter [Oceanispirochaeta sp. M1]RDG31461.1 DMT family transporter [Oceanispirochaeta sp. M1]